MDRLFLKLIQSLSWWVEKKTGKNCFFQSKCLYTTIVVLVIVFLVTVSSLESRIIGLVVLVWAICILQDYKQEFVKIIPRILQKQAFLLNNPLVESSYYRRNLSVCMLAMSLMASILLLQNYNEVPELVEYWLGGQLFMNTVFLLVTLGAYLEASVPKPTSE